VISYTVIGINIKATARTNETTVSLEPSVTKAFTEIPSRSAILANCGADVEAGIVSPAPAAQNTAVVNPMRMGLHGKARLGGVSLSRAILAMTV
jgi:hypothetical protein